MFKRRLPRSDLGWVTVSANIEISPWLEKHVKQSFPVAMNIPMTVTGKKAVVLGGDQMAVAPCKMIVNHIW